MSKTFFMIFALLLSASSVGQKSLFDVSISFHEPIDGDEVDMIPYRRGELYGFVAPNRPNEILIDPAYNIVLAVYSQGAIVGKGAGLGLVNSKGEILIPLKYDWLEYT